MPQYYWFAKVFPLSVSVPAMTAVAEMPVPSIQKSIMMVSPRMSAAASMPVPAAGVRVDDTIAAPVMSAAASMPVPTIARGVTIAAPVMSAAAAMPTPVVMSPVHVVGTPGAVNASSITLPAHQAGDIIVVFAFAPTSATIPSAPSAGGTVPAWTTIDTETYASVDNMASRSAYFIATGTTETSGTWSNANYMVAIALRGQGATPIGGHAVTTGSTSGGNAQTAPITLAQTDGTSAILAFFGVASQMNSWSSAPAGYTQQAAIASFSGVCLDTKNITTTDGAATQAISINAPGAYISQAIEIRAH